MIGKIFSSHASRAIEHTYYTALCAVPLIVTVPQTIMGSFVLCDLVYRSLRGQRSDNHFITENSDRISKFFLKGTPGLKTEVALDFMVCTVFTCAMGGLSFALGKTACKNIARVYGCFR